MSNYHEGGGRSSGRRRLPNRRRAETVTRRRAQPEAAVQRSVVQHLRLRGVPSLVFWHCPNGAYLGGKRNKRGIAIQGAIFKSLGARAGVADICLLHDGGFYSLELKALGNHSTEAQIAWRDDVNAAGGYATEAVGVDAAIRCLEYWGLLRGRTS